MYTHDVIVLGGGPAGGGVATILARAGKNVVMTESLAYGGVCPLRGCNPKKVLLSGAEAVHMAKGLSGKGVLGTPAVDWPELMAFKRSFSDSVPERAREAYAGMGIDVRLGAASFSGPETVEVNGETLSAPHVCVCVGQTPNALDALGCADLPVSDDFLELETLPRRLVFIGGGFIAFEFSHMARQAGAEVTLLNRSNRVLRRFDPLLAEALVAASRADGIDIRMERPIHSVEKAGQGYVVLCGEGGKDRVEADMVFNCTGRRPALDGLGLETAGVEFSRHGITVDERMRSASNPSVFALGDVADQGAALTPVATIQSQVAAANILEPDSAVVDYAGVPNVCYTLPPLAGAGLLEAEAQARGLDFEVKETDLAGSFPWQRLGETTGRARVLVSEKQDRILGAHLLGHNCEEIINLFAMIIRQDIPLSKVRDTVWAYPTCGYYLKYMV